MSDCLAPDSVTLVKIGSAIVHMQEIMSYTDFRIKPHTKVHHNALPSDLAALNACLDAPEMVKWLAEMDGLALIPKKR